MKQKIIAIVVFFAVSVFPAFADDNPVAKASMLIESGLFANEYSIMQIAKDIGSSDRLMLYQRYKKDDAIVGFLLNLVLGVGIGSYVQGDTQGGTIGLVGELGGVALILVGYASYNGSLLTTGSLLLIGTRVYEIIRPFTFVSLYNSRLSAALGIGGFSLDMYLLPSNAGMACSGFITVKLN